MGKIAFVFPGQGSQYLGMGKELAGNFPVAERIFQEASETLEVDLKKLCWEGPLEILSKTENTQPAMLTTDIACFEILKQKKIFPQVVAGHSLGEFSALIAAQALDFNDAVKLVRKRGQLSQKVGQEKNGQMAAIIGLDRERILEICEQTQKEGIVEPANYNSPGQIVISGEKKAVEAALELASQNGAKRIVVLPVSAPFHCSLMKAVLEEFSQEIKGTKFNHPQIPVVSNYAAGYAESASMIKGNLIKQLYSPVRWEESISLMINDDVDTFIEVGPGRVLSGLIKRTSSEANIYNVEDTISLQKTLQALKGSERSSDRSSIKGE